MAKQKNTVTPCAPSADAVVGRENPIKSPLAQKNPVLALDGTGIPALCEYRGSQNAVEDIQEWEINYSKAQHRIRWEAQLDEVRT